VRKALPEGPGRFSSGPEQSTITMLSSQPMRPVPITAMKIALGAA
jgi:hypothetical protein